MLLSFACAGEDVLLCEPLEIASSATVLGISVNLSRAGSYAIDDLRRAGVVCSASDCGGSCGSIVTEW